MVLCYLCENCVLAVNGWWRFCATCVKIVCWRWMVGDGFVLLVWKLCVDGEWLVMVLCYLCENCVLTVNGWWWFCKVVSKNGQLCTATTALGFASFFCHKSCSLCVTLVRRTDIRSFFSLLSVVQAGRLRVRFPVAPLEFFIDIFLPAALLPWGRLVLWQKWVPGIFSGG